MYFPAFADILGKAVTRPSPFLSLSPLKDFLTLLLQGENFIRLTGSMFRNGRFAVDLTTRTGLECVDIDMSASESMIVEGVEDIDRNDGSTKASDSDAEVVDDMK
jgi:hypothetical protein